MKKDEDEYYRGFYEGMVTIVCLAKSYLKLSKDMQKALMIIVSGKKGEEE